MRFAGPIRIWKKLNTVGLALSLAAFTPPQKDQLVELKGYLYGRSETKFRSDDNNKVLVLQPKTRGLIKQTKRMESGNYAVCLAIYNATDVKPDADCVWVYYDVKSPVLHLYTGITDDSTKKQILEAWAKEPQNKVTLKKAASVESAKAAMTTRETPAVVEKKVETPANQKTQVSADAKPKKAIEQDSVISEKPQKSADSGAKGADVQTPLKSTFQNIDQFNKNASQALSAKNQCPDGKCAPSVVTYAKCTAQNDYLENALASVINQSEISPIYQSNPKEFIKTSCVRTNLEVFKSGPFRVCSGNSSTRKAVPRACISQNYVDVTAKSFNLLVECLGEDLAGSDESKPAAAMSIFSLMAVESGMHVNAKSPTGPGGTGQLSHFAIGEVNNRLKPALDRLASSSNPLCSKTLANVLKTKMNRHNSCDRINVGRDNPLKNMAYTFLYQKYAREAVDKVVLSTGTFRSLTSQLSRTDRERMSLLLASWAHNVGVPGFLPALRAKLMIDTSQGIKLKNSNDVDNWVKGMRPYLASHAVKENKKKGRISETMNYFKKMQDRMDLISKDRNACLAK